MSDEELRSSIERDPHGLTIRRPRLALEFAYARFLPSCDRQFTIRAGVLASCLAFVIAALTVAASFDQCIHVAKPETILS